jgi:hypothetical protein
MREEADSLHLMVAVLPEQKDFEKEKIALNPSIVQLVKIDQSGFLEPFALLPYRDAHRETIYRYFDEFVVPKAP